MMRVKLIFAAIAVAIVTGVAIAVALAIQPATAVANTASCVAYLDGQGVAIASPNINNACSSGAHGAVGQCQVQLSQNGVTSPVARQACAVATKTG